MLMDEEYNNAINALKHIGDKSLTESNWSLKEYVNAVKELCNKYGEEKVKRDLGMK